MFGSSSERLPDGWEPPVGGPIAEPLVPELIVLFGLRACWFESFPFDVQLPRIEPGRIVLPADEPGVSSWSLHLGVELPVRYCGLTVGRYVLVAASPTSGVDFSPAVRDEAIAMVAPVGTLIAACIIEGKGTATSLRVAQPLAPNSGQELTTNRRHHRLSVARRRPRTPGPERKGLE
jgi:hypothetical protein